MPAMRQVPSNMPHEGLTGLLEDITARVRAGDSFEGTITWSIPEDPGADPQSFDVTASYRTGNLEGQGGMRVIGEWAEPPPGQALLSAAHAAREGLAVVRAAEEKAGRLEGGREITAIETVLDILGRTERTITARPGR
jgi:hypothetical protein